MKDSLKNALKSLLFLVIGIFILSLIFKGQSSTYMADCMSMGKPATECSLWDKLWRDFSQVKWIWIGVVVVLFTVSNWSRAKRWLLLLKPLGVEPKLTNSFLSIMLGYFANLGIPRIGEVVRAGTLSRYEEISLDKSMGTIVTDRILDVLSLAIVLLIALVFAYDIIMNFLNENVDVQGLMAFFGLDKIILLLGIFLVLIFVIRYIFRSASANGIIERIKKFILGFKEGLLSIREVDNPGALVFHSILIWLMYYLMTYCCFLAFEPTAELGMMAGFVTFVFGSLGMIVPLPGGMGSYHFCVMAALGLYGVSGSDSFSFAMIIFFSIQIFCNILLGLFSLTYLPIYNKKF